MSKGRILIVEDDEDVAGLLDYNLRNIGYVTMIAFDGRTACRLIETEKPDLILLDIMLPGVDGWQICRMIRNHEREDLSDIPIIMVTALGSVNEKLKGIEMGADDYIPKPFSVKEILCKVDRLMERELKKKRLDMKVKRLEAKEMQRADFQDMLFHELRNQLTIIGGYSAQIATGRFLSIEKYRQCAGVIKDCTHSLSSVTEEMLLLSRLETGDYSLPSQDVSLPETLRHVVAAISRRADEKGVHIHVEPPERLPTLRLNPTAVKAVLANLIENAVKYSPQRAAVMIRTKPEKEVGVTIEVENKGPVIPASERDKVFEKFYRGESVRTSTKGTGLGLYLSKTVMESMGGILRLKGSSEKGTCFSVTFPLPPSSQRQGPA